MGKDARVMNSGELVISNFIKADWREIQFTEDELQEDRGMLYLFPIADNAYCLQLCYLQYEDNTSNATVYSVTFLPPFFDQYPADVLSANQPFRFDQTTEQQFSVCSQSRTIIDQLHQDVNLPPLLKSMQRTTHAMQLLRRALECITVPFTVCQVPACRFLAHESEREKINYAVQIIVDNVDQPHTIRELARKVAMNECYLKKGFKAIVGKTIHEYQQELRISKAKVLLQEEGRSVTDVANILGFSSISHFSTAFKRVTGLKPCELLA
jgi:AraC-like DNA-binding protein